MPGSLRGVLASIANAKAAGALVAAFFVAMRDNIGDWPGAAKLAVGAGADAVVFNRFQPGGRGLANWKHLAPEPGQLVEALAQARDLESLCTVNLGTIVPPCELRGAAPAHLGSSRFHHPVACPVGTESAYPCIGPDGTLRPCNHTPRAAGSLLEEDFPVLMRSPCMTRREADTPPECRCCADFPRCGGGCPSARREAGEPIYACQAAHSIRPLSGARRA